MKISGSLVAGVFGAATWVAIVVWGVVVTHFM